MTEWMLEEALAESHYDSWGFTNQQNEVRDIPVLACTASEGGLPDLG
jgi:hypothetical protein